MPGVVGVYTGQDFMDYNPLPNAWPAGGAAGLQNNNNMPRVLATGSVNSNLTSANPYAVKNGLDKIVAGGTLWIEQIKAISVTLCLAVVGTIVIAYVVKAIVGLRPNEEVETLGLDLAEHGEEGYHGA